MKISKFVDELVQNSECFSYDAYVQGLRRFIQHEALNEKIGTVQIRNISAAEQKNEPLALFFGETHRVTKRYRLIEDLLSSNKSVLPKSTKYYKTLFRFYRNKSAFQRLKGDREIKRKIQRIQRINQWVLQNQDFHGLQSFLDDKPVSVSRKDYPILITLKSKSCTEIEVQLDGSHRRCVALYNNFSKISTLVISFEEISAYMNVCNEPYLSQYFDLFESMLESINN